MAEVILKAPAKVNLFLEVLGKRSDGYHDIETVFQEISIADTIILKETPSSDIIIRSESPGIPVDETNLAFRAASLFREYVREKKRGIAIEIKKNIPVASGLGGGSSDAASTLKGLNRLWKTGLDKSVLLNLAEKIGMDVPFFIEGGLSLGRGRGEKLTPISASPLLWFLVIAPKIRVSTAWVYKQLSNSCLTGEKKENKILLEALRLNDTGKIGKNLFNRLEEVTMRSYKEIADLKQKLLSAGAMGALMSGSGPALFGIFPGQQGASKTRDALQCKEGVYVAKGNSVKGCM